MIRAVSQDVIHNITSGQVVVDLQSIVKELLENALDAGAKSISISLKSSNNQLEYIEITDNGMGIDSGDFSSLVLKNYTSKLRNFQGLKDVTTLGFRGEALNAISSMSKMEIKTATGESAPRGWALEYSKNGDLLSKTSIGHTKGTTIRISELFNNLPVRKSNLQKNYKREFQRVMNGLLPYFIILLDVRLAVFHIENQNTKKLMMKTNGNKVIKDNIINVFGATGLNGLEEIQSLLDVDGNTILVNGLTSNSSFGHGRSSKDRQFIYINGRPVEWKSLLKLSNETYKKFNYLQFPVVILNFTIDTTLLDINVTPDKKIVMLDRIIERGLFDEFVDLLEKKWNQQGNYVIPLNKTANEQIKNRNSTRQISLESYISTYNSTTEFEDEVEDDTSIEVDVIGIESVNPSKRRKIGLNQMDSIDGSIDVDSDHKEEEEEKNEENKRPLLSRSIPSAVEMDLNLTSTQQTDSIHQGGSEEDILQLELNNIDQIEVNEDKQKLDDAILIDINEAEHQSSQKCTHESKEIIFNSLIESNDNLIPVESNRHIDFNDAGFVDDQQRSLQPEINFETSRLDETVVCRLLISDLHLSQIMESCHEKCDFKATDITDGAECERQLTLNVHKKDFLDMQIIGQFNKGFIIVRNPITQDIFIVDQHASDEKYNFEMIYAKTKINSQRLVVPELLELNSIDKLTISSNLSIFEKNGFQFKFTLNPDTQIEDVYLLALPYSKATTFTISDLHELIHLIQNNTSKNANIRPSKVRSMFAMRACRSSIMIGQSLSTNKMIHIVTNLSNLDKPWNCPHGRPTMRHLVKMAQWESFNYDYRL